MKDGGRLGGEVMERGEEGRRVEGGGRAEGDRKEEGMEGRREVERRMG